MADDMPVVVTTNLMQKVDSIVEVDKAAAEARSRALSDERVRGMSIVNPNPQNVVKSTHAGALTSTTPAELAANLHRTNAANPQVAAASIAMAAQATEHTPQAPETTTGAVVDTTS